MIHTTFALCHKAGACSEGYRTLAKALGGVTNYGRNTPIPLATIIDTNSIQDALWALRCVLPDEEAIRDRIARLMACDCAGSVLAIYEAKYPGDTRVRDCIAVVRRYALGQATESERSAAQSAAWSARSAAWSAAELAAWSARSAARSAAWSAAESARLAAESAAWSAAWSAAELAAESAAWSAAESAAWSAAAEMFRKLLNEDQS